MLEWLHRLEHLSFFFTSLLFWWTLFHGRGPGRGERTREAVAIGCLFLTILQPGLLGALLTLSPHIIYPSQVQFSADALPVDEGAVLLQDDARGDHGRSVLRSAGSESGRTRPAPALRNRVKILKENEKSGGPLDRRFSVAPMMDWTDRHCRFFHRLLTRRALLYTEMLTTGAVIHGDRGRLMAYDPAEHPVALQLGGSEPAALAEAARIGADFGYDEINLNVGCPSDRVQEGRFGACLMAEPALVAEGVSAMKAAVRVPVTVKCRIGIDEQDPEPTLFGFADRVKAAGADALIVHARKAWLQGLSPKENREVPPLDYALVHRLKAAHRGWPVSLNGGIATIEQAKAEMGALDGVMMGRAAYQEPWRLIAVDPEIFGEPAPFAAAKEAARAMLPYIERELGKGVRLSSITRHMLGLFRAVPGARAFRRHLATEAVKPGADARVLEDALAPVLDSAADLSHIAA